MKQSLRGFNRYLVIVLCALLGWGAAGATARADKADASYNYSYWEDTVAAPQAYQATRLYKGSDFGVGPLKEPADLHVTADKQIYLLDSGNNRIIILDADFRLLRVVDSFDRSGKKEQFNKPQGLFVTNDKHVYVADTGNKRVVHLDEAGKLVQIIESPKSELLPGNFEFQPIRLVVDKAQRVYTMAAGVFDGLMEFSSDGTFTSFMGANRVSVNPMDYLWKRLSTKAQRSQMVMYTPTEFSNLDIDDEDFIYATNSQRHDNVKKLNAQGSDILRRQGYYPPEGDLYYTKETGATRLVDIDAGDSEMYSILDATRGRVLTYNGDGFLLYVFGRLGNQLGEFNSPVALDRFGDDMLVLDKGLGEVTRFQTTAYGRTLNEAVRSYYKGEEDKAARSFEQVINLNANLEYAYDGIGKSLIRQGRYAEAMKYFKNGMDQSHYSKAFLLHRKQVMKQHFTAIALGLLAVVALFIAWKKIRKRRGGNRFASFGQRVG
ncbi:SMP-30/gluconolactonase/LRE family protein [Gorillibacterium sp. sgz500922]|uniref:SMP-30/gluconolactonase/LRE family protein n=1 Tax=Gorillibacterium sp. sgz500922 TaxID=3446694 RepID=UPI003F67A091